MHTYSFQRLFSVVLEFGLVVLIFYFCWTQYSETIQGKNLFLIKTINKNIRYLLLLFLSLVLLLGSGSRSRGSSSSSSSSSGSSSSSSSSRSK